MLKRRAKRSVQGVDESGVVRRIDYLRCRHCGIDVLAEELEGHERKCLQDPQNRKYALERARNASRQAEPAAGPKHFASPTEPLPVSSPNGPSFRCKRCDARFEDRKERDRHRSKCNKGIQQSSNSKDELFKRATAKNVPLSDGQSAYNGSGGRRAGKKRRVHTTKSGQDRSLNNVARVRDKGLNDNRVDPRLEQKAEPKDGSRHYGHRFRESGRFGSHPMHDDYSEESDAD